MGLGQEEDLSQAAMVDLADEKGDLSQGFIPDFANDKKDLSHGVMVDLADVKGDLSQGIMPDLANDKEDLSFVEGRKVKARQQLTRTSRTEGCFKFFCEVCVDDVTGRPAWEQFICSLYTPDSHYLSSVILWCKHRKCIFSLTKNYG